MTGGVGGAETFDVPPSCGDFRLPSGAPGPLWPLHSSESSEEASVELALVVS